MSICSNASDMSVSFCGEEMPFDQAIDTLFRDLQSFVNDTHCNIRQLAQCEERADTYIEALRIWMTLDSNVAGALTLFSELRSISKQVLGKPPKESRDQVNELLAAFKKKLVLDKRAKLEAKSD